ncbi:MAG: cell division protein PerM [Pseudonocardiaceae bacterium]
MSLLLSPVSRGPAGEATRLGRAATIGAACLPAVASYLTAVAVLTAVAAASGTATSVAWVARAGAVGWLAAHHVPLTIDGAPLGVLPLLPTLLLGALVARGAADVANRAGVQQPAEAGWVAGSIAGIHGILGAALALIATPATVTVDAAQAAVGCGLVAGVAAGLGLAGPCGLLPAALRQAPDWVRPGLIVGLWGQAVLLTAGLAVVLIGLVASVPELVSMAGSDAGSILGLIALSIGYLPNAAIAGLSWLAGPGFSVGALSVSPVTMQAGPVPAVPLLAALPQGPPQPWWGLALAVPLLVGAAVGRRSAAAGRDVAQRLRILGAAAVVLALGSAVLGALAGGRLGVGAFDPVDIPFGTLAVAVLAATLLGGSVATLLVSRGVETEPSAASATDETATGETATDETATDETGIDVEQGETATQDNATTQDDSGPDDQPDGGCDNPAPPEPGSSAAQVDPNSSAV